MKKIRYLITPVLGIMLLLLSINYKELHRKYLYNSMKYNVVKVLDGNLKSGGTGFHITSKGKTYILTNSHVCGKKKYVVIKNKYMNYYIKKVLAISKKHDLCLIEPVLKRGIVLGSYPSIGDNVYTIGFPGLNGLRLEEGHLTGWDNINICTQSSFFLCMKFETYYSTWLSIVVIPGSSGSPVLNSSGDLIAVIFATGQKRFSYAVPLSYIESFLKNYDKRSKINSKSP